LVLLLQDESFRMNPKELLMHKLILFAPKKTKDFLLPLPLSQTGLRVPPLHEMERGIGGEVF